MGQMESVDKGRAWVLFFSLQFTQKDGASPLAESRPVTLSRDQHARPLLDPSRSRLDSCSTSISPPLIYGSLPALFSLHPHAHSSNDSSRALLPWSGLLSPSSSPRRYADVMNGICGIFGSEMCYCVIVFLFFFGGSFFHSFSPVAVPLG